jgi:hypothetical protein
MRYAAPPVADCDSEGADAPQGVTLSVPCNDPHQGPVGPAPQGPRLAAQRQGVSEMALDHLLNRGRPRLTGANGTLKPGEREAIGARKLPHVAFARHGETVELARLVFEGFFYC